MDSQCFTEVENPFFKNIVLAANPNCEIPSRMSIRRDVHRAYIAARDWIKEKLKGIYSRISCSTDYWTSKYRYFPFMGVNLHWISSDWKVKTLGLCFIPLQGQHTGGNLCKHFTKDILQKNMCRSNRCS